MRLDEDRNLRLPDGRLFGQLSEDGKVNGASGQAMPPTIPFSPLNASRDVSGRVIVRVDERGVFRSADGSALAKIEEGVLVFE